jgi:hypothetical protein
MELDYILLRPWKIEKLLYLSVFIVKACLGALSHLVIDMTSQLDTARHCFQHWLGFSKQYCLLGSEMQWVSDVAETLKLVEVAPLSS